MFDHIKEEWLKTYLLTGAGKTSDAVSYTMECFLADLTDQNVSDKEYTKRAMAFDKVEVAWYDNNDISGAHAALVEYWK